MDSVIETIGDEIVYEEHQLSRSVMGSKSKKGSSFEREMCVRLSKWWSKGEREDIFWRSSGSGARAKVRGRQGKLTEGQHGDISAIHPSGGLFVKLFTVELKRGYSKHTIFDCMDKEKKAAPQEFEKWFQQVHESMQHSKTLGWMIIQKRDRRRAFVFYSFSVYQKFFADLISLRRPTLHINMRVKMSDGKKQELIIMGCPLDNFLKVITPEHIHRIHKEERQYRKNLKIIRKEKEKAERAELRKTEKLQKTRKKKGRV
jgi:hypothetical protein